MITLYLHVKAELYVDNSAVGLTLCCCVVSVWCAAQPAEYGGPKMHRDIKPSNMCFRMVDGHRLMVVMDFGGWCNQDMSTFHPVLDIT